jgi:glycosyltransferase involved in cell wall biosynthesis
VQPGEKVWVVRALLIAYYFPPMGGMGSIRALGMARHLPAAGVEVAVVAPRAGTYATDESLVLPEGLSVERTGTLEPAVLLRRSRRAGSGGGDGGGGGSGSALRRFLYVPDSNNGWIPFAVRSAMKVARRRRPDVILSSAPPLSALVAGATVARRLRIPFVPDFRDFFATQRLFSGSRERIDRAIEGRVLARMKGYVAATEGVARDLARRTDAPSIVVGNGYDEEDFAGPAPETGRPLTLVHVGSSYADRKDPAAFLRAVAAVRADGTDLRLRMIGAPDPAFAAAAETCGVADALEQVPFTGHREAIDEIRKAWALLLYVWAGDPVVAEGVRAGKSLEYLRSGRPILFVGPLDGENARLVRETGGTVRFDFEDEAGIAEGLRALAAGDRPEPARPDRLASHSREAGARRLAAWLADLIGSRG